MMGMRAASAVTNKLAGQQPGLAAAGLNASVVLESVLTLASLNLAGFVTGFIEIGVSMQGPQESAESEPRNAESRESAARSGVSVSL